ncbi:alpha/beta hydrolase family protein [Streptomyces sp. NPDC001595]|uniref:alpha/beta hydrolase family protein n=1 Tax=Streptomyces sp. NPDC001532 TaxID=3154520 RepID=UPI00331B2403
MTVFILVAGVFTGTHVWQETAARLTAAGSEVRAVPLTAVDATRPATSAGVDLETHIADVIAEIDAVDTAGPAAEDVGEAGNAVGGVSGREIVLVGHDYGIHPVLGAVDRRSQRVSRVVYLDCGMPQNGVPALAAVPDQALRARLAEQAQRALYAGELAPPAAREEWQRWGSTADVGDAALDRLTALAAPQPLGTLLQPLRLTEAVTAAPTTGVLCTLNGVSVDMVQQLVDLGDPVLAALTDPAVSFFDLPTGHWPMLSRPAELADVLLRAAAGEGRRLRPAGAGAPPAHRRPFPLDVPELPRDREGHVDLYVPDGEGPRPAVVFVHGGPVPAGSRPTPREWPTMVGYARLAAAEGMVGVTLDHRLHDVTDYERAAEDVTAAVDLVRADPRVDADRIALWFLSGGGPLTADWLRNLPAWLRCVAASYPILAPMPNWGLSGDRFRPAEAVAHAGDLPVVLLRAGLEAPEIAATVEAFVTAAKDSGTRLELIDVPNGHHGFETIDPPEETRPALRQAIRSVVTHLTD